MSKPHIASDDGVVAYSDASQNGSIGIHGHIVLKYGMTGLVDGMALFIITEILGTEGNSLIQHYVVADYARGPNYDASAVVNCKILSYGGGGVDVYTCLIMGHLSDDARDTGHIQTIQHVSGAVMQHYLYARIAKYHLAYVAGGGVIV